MKVGSSAANSPHLATLTSLLVLPSDEPKLSIFLTTSYPFTTLPNTTCLPSSHAVLAVHRKNCEPLVPGPALAIESTPGPVCFSVKFSSANFSPYIDLPPVPSWLVKSPPWHMKSGITRWNEQSLYPKPGSPVHSCLKFSAVFGTTSLRSCMTILPISSPSAVISKKTFGFPRSLSVLSIVPPTPYTFSVIHASSASSVSYFSFILPPSLKSARFSSIHVAVDSSSLLPHSASTPGLYRSARGDGSGTGILLSGRFSF